MSSAAFKVGDRVWFVSKYRRRVEGVFEGMGSQPMTGRGSVEVALVRSDNAFGDLGLKGVLCSVSPSSLRRVEGDGNTAETSAP